MAERKWDKTVVGEWEIPAQAFDSTESASEIDGIVYPIEIQDKFNEVDEENEKAKEAGSAEMSGLTVVGPVDKDGREVYYVRKLSYKLKEDN